MSVTVVALGDSFSCGEGVGLDIRPEQTWPTLLCAALPGAVLMNLSTAGARVRDVRRHQLATAVAARPQLATVMVGLNDIIRSGLSAAQLAIDMQLLVDELLDCGATVLIARWHDPGAVLGLPSGLRRALAARLAAVNDAVDAAAASATPRGRPTRGGDPYVLSLDLGRIPELTDPGAWAVDGIHPSPAGHRAIALSASRILAGGGPAGLRSGVAAELLLMPPGPGRARRALWLCSRGLPWLAQHSGRVVPAVASMAAQAIRDPRPSTVEQALEVWLRSAAEEVEFRVGAVNNSRSQPLPGRVVARVGQRSRAPEIARTGG